MAAIFYSPQKGKDIFKSGFNVNTSISIPFLNKMIGSSGGFSIITDVTIQNRDTIQYFITFDDFISYFYFGKGLGAININGVMFSDCEGYFKGAGMLTNIISKIRGTVQTVSFGNVIFSGVLSSFTIQANSEGAENNVVNFNLTLDIIRHSLPPPKFSPSC